MAFSMDAQIIQGANTLLSNEAMVSAEALSPTKCTFTLPCCFEDSRDTEAGGQRATERVNEYVDLLAGVFGKGFINGLAGEVLASDMAL